MADNPMPDNDQLFVLKSALDWQSGKTDVRFRESISEECCDKGWVRKLGAGYELTVSGRAVLRKAEKSDSPERLAAK